MFFHTEPGARSDCGPGRPAISEEARKACRRDTRLLTQAIVVRLHTRKSQPERLTLQQSKPGVSAGAEQVQITHTLT